MEVIVHDDDIDRALRDLKRMILRDGIFREIKDRQEPSASVRRRNKERKAERRRMKRGGNGRRMS